MNARTKSPANRNRCPASLKTLIAAESPDQASTRRNCKPPHVIQIMFDTETAGLQIRLYVRQITTACDGGRNAATSGSGARAYVSPNLAIREQDFRDCEQTRGSDDGQ